MAKIQPMELKFAFHLPLGSGMYNLDIAQVLSIVNRKAMRQGYEYVVQDMEFVADGNAVLSFATLPTSWIQANSWVKAYKLWRESQDQVLDVEGRDILGKYADFKIFFDTFHALAGVGANLVPNGYAIAAGGATYKWDPTTYQIPNDPAGGTTTEYTIHAIGPSTATSLAMIAGYAASRARPQQNDPNVVDHLSADAWMLDLFDVGENLDEIRTDIEDDNDAPPYLNGAPGSQLEYYPGGAINAATWVSFVKDALVIRSATSLAMDNTGPFTAPCGLVRLDVVVGAPAPAFMTLFLTLAAGPYKGVMARPMRELN